MNEVQLQGCTRPELLALAGKAKVRGRHRMTKDQLIRAIRSRAATASRSRRRRRSALPETEAAGRVAAVLSPVLVKEEQPEVKELAELPSSYGHTRLTLMPIDPYHIHAYWEVTPHDRETTMTRLGPEGAKARWVLRFYDVTYIDFDGTNAHVYFDQPIDLIAGNWYVELWSSEKTYCADIGALAPSGQFESACRSNFVQVPRAEASTDYRPEWLRVEGNFDKVQAAVIAAESSPAEQSAALTMTATIAPPEQELAPQEPIPFAAEADIRRHYAALVPTAWENRAREPSTTAANDAARCVRQDVPGETPPAGARREAHFPETVSSFGSGVWRPAGRTAAGLTLNADVVISGRGQPGQAIQVNGQWLKASADGTFSVRLALPIKE